MIFQISTYFDDYCGDVLCCSAINFCSFLLLSKTRKLISNAINLGIKGNRKAETVEQF